jgi:hypothetical protein
MINRMMAIGDGPIKTFPLRGVKDNPPYLHDERLLTMEDTVEFFNLILGTTYHRRKRKTWSRSSAPYGAAVRSPGSNNEALGEPWHPLQPCQRFGQSRYRNRDLSRTSTAAA